MTGRWIKYRLIFPALVIVTAGAACQMGPRLEPFINPIESRLILQVPFYSADDTTGCAAAALAAAMTYGGRPISAEKIELALGGRQSAQAMVVLARQEGLKADLYAGSPDNLVESVRRHKPIIVRVDRAAGPLGRGDYAVVAGYTPDGPVVNSCAVNQQIIAWKDFLAGWHAASYLTLLIEPLE